MSTIRPDLPALPQASTGAPATVSNAQAAFFRAALAQVQTTAVQPVVTPQTTERPAASTAPSDTGRIARPGSLLDIRV